MKGIILCEESGVVGVLVEGFPLYAVTTCGRIFSRNGYPAIKQTFTERKPGRDKKGYLGITLCAGADHHKWIRVHRLVAQVFIPNPLRLPCVRHLNGVPSDNRVSNLAWGTYKENEEDKHAHGTWDTRRNGKLTEEMRNQAGSLAGSGMTHAQIAIIFGVSRPTITRCLNQVTWSGP